MKLESCRNFMSDEIETTITMTGNGADGFRVYTTSNSMLTKIGKLLDAPDTAWKLEKVERYSDGVPSGYFFTCSAKSCLSLKAKKAAGREMTEEEKRRSFNVSQQAERRKQPKIKFKVKISQRGWEIKDNSRSG